MLARIEAAAIGADPFHHAFIEAIFPPDLYDAVRAFMVQCKYGDGVQDRHQDNPAFLNKRYNLSESTAGVAGCLRTIFTDAEVKQQLLGKFFLAPSPQLAESLSLHDEFEFLFTKAGRFQNIHVDIPPKYLSFVFYIPERAVPPAEEARNATVFYDKSLAPQYRARFIANSVCVFVPHFHTYHGFSSTIDRDVLVMFYVNRDELCTWQTMRREGEETPPFTELLDAIEAKLRLHPVIEFGSDARRLRAERSACLVNAPQGRVLVGEQWQHRAR